MNLFYSNDPDFEGKLDQMKKEKCLVEYDSHCLILNPLNMRTSFPRYVEKEKFANILGNEVFLFDDAMLEFAEDAFLAAYALDMSTHSSESLSFFDGFDYYPFADRYILLAVHMGVNGISVTNCMRLYRQCHKYGIETCESDLFRFLQWSVLYIRMFYTKFLYSNENDGFIPYRGFGIYWDGTQEQLNLLLNEQFEAFKKEVGTIKGTGSSNTVIFPNVRVISVTEQKEIV